ncbi:MULTISPECIES: hypothetical protein [unclassified Amycolatopsis]|uniref:hypothetical protein n=1 Tax=unclassified Amycolatopsis TaxID=2618356 RepID=UPI00106DF268|nr:MULTISPECIES: hypothetical protein [unclassified Amycolatopsis]
MDDAFPGWVEVQFSEADGTQVTLVEKLPVLDTDRTTESPYPAQLRISCRVTETEPDGATAVVILDHGVTDRAGRSTFHVPASAISHT